MAHVASGWELVANTEEVKKDVIGAHDWGCEYVALKDGTHVQTGTQEGARKEWKWGLEKHRKKGSLPSAQQLDEGADIDAEADGCSSGCHQVNNERLRQVQR